MNKSLILFILTFLIYNCLCGYSYSDCSEFERKKQDLCEALEPGDGGQICNMINNECISTYRDCGEYKENVDQKICESISPQYQPNKKCIFSENKCISQSRTCSDFKFGLEPNSNCRLLTSKEQNKRCVFVNNVCEEQYKSCDSYLGNDEKECNSILPFDERDGEQYNYKCSFENGKWVQKDRFCEDYIPIFDFSYYCEDLSPSDKSKRCAFVKNKCIEQYYFCNDYKGKDKETCESIIPYEDFSKKCVLEGDNCVQKEKTSCSDYKPGEDNESCESIKLNDEKKTCVMLNGECLETYKTCESYEGDDQKTCESIYPTYYKDDIYRFDYDTKCVLKNKKCEKIERYCSEFIYNGKYCNGLKVKEENKICFDYKGNCIESYETCENYNQNVDKNTCEEIVPSSYSYQKCVYDSENNLCKSENLSCSSIQTDLYKNKCESLGFQNYLKCIYSNGKCIEDSQPDPRPDAESSLSGSKGFYISKLILISYCLLIL